MVLCGFFAVVAVFIGIAYTHGRLPEPLVESVPASGPDAIIVIKDYEPIPPEPVKAKKEKAQAPEIDIPVFDGDPRLINITNRINGWKPTDGLKPTVQTESFRAPRVSRKSSIQYPSALRNRGVSGRVLIACKVDHNGNVANVKLRESSGYPQLDHAALNGVRKWRFNPAMRDGKKVSSTAIIPVVFRASTE